jgi:hypothetical protein
MRKRHGPPSFRSVRPAKMPRGRRRCRGDALVAWSALPLPRKRPGRRQSGPSRPAPVVGAPSDEAPVGAVVAAKAPGGTAAAAEAPWWHRRCRGGAGAVALP